MLEDKEEVEDSLCILIYEGLMVEAWSLAGLLQKALTKLKVQLHLTPNWVPGKRPGGVSVLFS